MLCIRNQASAIFTKKRLISRSLRYNVSYSNFNQRVTVATLVTPKRLV